MGIDKIGVGVGDGCLAVCDYFMNNRGLEIVGKCVPFFAICDELTSDAKCVSLCIP